MNRLIKIRILSFHRSLTLWNAISVRRKSLRWNIITLRTSRSFPSSKESGIRKADIKYDLLEQFFFFKGKISPPFDEISILILCNVYLFILGRRKRRIRKISIFFYPFLNQSKSKRFSSNIHILYFIISIIFLMSWLFLIIRILFHIIHIFKVWIRRRKVYSTSNEVLGSPRGRKISELNYIK